jgi:hypothetical protein
MYPRSMADSDCVVIQGSNMAECHPVAFRWPMQAKSKGAKLTRPARGVRTFDGAAGGSATGCRHFSKNGTLRAGGGPTRCRRLAHSCE